MEGVAVEVGVHGHGGDAELLAGTDDPDGDLAPVGDQDLGEHAIWLQAMPGDACQIGARRDALRRRPLGRRDRLDQRRPARARPATARPRASCWSPTTRPPAGAGSAALGRRRPARRCCCRCCCGPPRRGRRAPADDGGRRWPRPRRVDEVAGVAPAAEVAERPGGGRATATAPTASSAGILAEADCVDRTAGSHGAWSSASAST